MYLVTYPAKGPRHGYPDLILRSGYPYRGPSYDMHTRRKALPYSTTYVVLYGRAYEGTLNVHYIYYILYIECITSAATVDTEMGQHAC